MVNKPEAAAPLDNPLSEKERLVLAVYFTSLESPRTEEVQQRLQGLLKELCMCFGAIK